MEKQWIYNGSYFLLREDLRFKSSFFCQIYANDYQANSSQIYSQDWPIFTIEKASNVLFEIKGFIVSMDDLLCLDLKQKCTELKTRCIILLSSKF